MHSSYLISANREPVFQLIGGALFVSAAESIFANRLLYNLSVSSDMDPIRVLETGFSNMENSFSQEDLPAIMTSYAVGLKAAWTLGVALAVAAAVSCWGPENRCIKVTKRSK
jgi:MFS transporter, DHA2 family, glioxin efflux transporter